MRGREGKSRKTSFTRIMTFGRLLICSPVKKKDASNCRPHQSSSLEVLSSKAPHVSFLLSGFEGMASSPGSLRYCPRVSLFPHLYSPPGPRVEGAQEHRHPVPTPRVTSFLQITASWLPMFCWQPPSTWQMQTWDVWGHAYSLPLAGCFLSW